MGGFSPGAVGNDGRVLSFNDRMFRAELVTPEPIGAGSQFLVASTMMRRTVEMTVEFTAFERPRLLGSTSRAVMQGRKGRPLVIVGSLTFDPAPEGTRMRWSWHVDTPGAMKLLTPLLERMGRRREQRVWSSLKRLLEDQRDLSLNRA